MTLRLTTENDLLDIAAQNPQMLGFVVFNLDVPLENGKVAPLWSITPREDTMTTKKREDRRQAVASHQRRVDLYAERVANGLSPFTGEPMPTDEGDDLDEVVETPQAVEMDDWHRFWGGATPTEKYAMTCDD